MFGKSKKIRIAGSIAVAFLALLCFSACGKTEPEETEELSTEAPVPEVKMVTIAENVVYDFTRTNT